jgi:SAM-dependent methyltransferase
MLQFDFGKNWAEFSENALSAERIRQAAADFDALHAEIGGVGSRSFIDIGFGQGLSLLRAAALGASVLGVDINPKCGEVLRRNRSFFPEIQHTDIPLVIGSILDERTVQRARDASPSGAGYDIVHSWGVLHHTGDMQLAIRNATSLVKPEGYFVVAIYNRHWSSLPWLAIKYLYCKSPSVLQGLLVRVLEPVIYVAKWLVTKEDPRKQSRGMDFFYNVVDWVGGYPYQYASVAEMSAILQPLGFQKIKIVPSEVPTGCNEFIFRRCR